MGLASTLFGDDAELFADRDFQILLLASVSSPLGSSVVSPILDSLTGPLGASEAEIGLLMAAFTAPAIVCIPLVGLISDRVGRKPVLASGLLLYGVAGLAIPLTTSFEVVLGLRLLQGLGYTGIAPTLITVLGDLYEGGREAAAQGLRFTTVGVAMTALPLISGALVALAWQYPFALYAIAVPTALVVALRFEEPLGRSSVSTDGGATDGPGGEVGDSLGGSGETLRGVAALLRRPPVAAMVLGRAVPSFLWFAFLTYNSIVVVRLVGATPGAAGAVVAIASAASAVAATQVGRLTAAFETRRIPLFGSTVLLGAGVAGVGVAPTVAVAGLSAVLVGAGFGVVLSLYRSTISSFAPDALRGSLVSAGESVGRTGSTLAPVVMGAAVVALGTTFGVDTAAAVRLTVAVTAVVGVAVGGLLVAVAVGGDGSAWEAAPLD